MENKEAIIEATTGLINEKGEQLNAVTMREICKKAGVGLGLINYYFGSKDRLIELCVERIVNEIVDRFAAVSGETDGLTPFEKLDHLGNMTFTFLFEHASVSRISIMTDMQKPKENDNTHRTYMAYLPLVSACRPGWSEERVRRTTYCLITVMQQAFLRSDMILRTQGVNLQNEEERRSFHRQMLKELLGGTE